MALDFPVGTDFPANGNQIPNGEIYEGFYWDAATGAWKRLCERDKIGDCLDDDTDETVCDQLESLRLGLVEIEEELESIAPAVERGVWLYEQQTGTNAVLRPPNPARYFLIKNYTAGDTLIDPNVVEFTTEYSEADAVVFNNIQWNIDDENGLGGSSHDWSTVEVDEIIDLFDKPDDDGLFGKITEVTDTHYGNDAILIAFDRIETLGSPTNSEPFLTRLKIFKEPTGGEATEFVRKTGDKMSGTLTMGDTLDMPDGSNTDSPTVTFKAKNSSGTIRTHTLQLKSSGTTLYSSSAFRASGAISAGGNIQYNGSDRINMGSSSSIHELKIGSSIALQWDSTYGIRGIRAANSWGTSGKFLAYSSSYGLEWVSPPSNTTTNYVKTNSTGFSNNLTITKSGGVYYITGG